LSRANTLATQFRKAKEDADRRYHSRVHELQERLDQANTTKRSMENYVNFLKSSYASVFNDSATPGSPLPTFNL
jgi:outer dense fiber protein 2